MLSTGAGGGCGKALNQQRGFSLGPALEAQRGLKTPKMLLCSVCGYLAAAKSSFVQQVPGLITG